MRLPFAPTGTRTSAPALARTKLLFSGAIAAALAACGGSDGDGGTTTPPPTTPPANQTVTLSGTVMVDKAIRNAVVCMDLNANGSCDAGEPASARTGADGAYSLSYQTNAVSADQVKAASLITKMVPGALSADTTTIDAADTTEGNTAKPYVLRQVAGKSGQINPLTTLVAVGMAAGMSEADARANVAAQLSIAESKIDGYQDDAAGSLATADTARFMAKITAAALEDGAAVRVGDLKLARPASSTLANLRYVDFNNVTYRTLDAAERAANTAGPVLVIDRRGGRGANATPAALYTQAYLTADGFRFCNDLTPITVTSGTPDRSVYCNSLKQSTFVMAPVSIAGRTMASVVNEMQQSPTSNTLNAGLSTANLIDALGAAVFPAGSEMQSRTSVTLNQPVYINNMTTDARPGSESTFAQMIAARQSSAVNLSNGAATLSLGISSSETKALRVAFAGPAAGNSGAVQYYECTLDATQTVLSACSATQTGTYEITTGPGIRLMRFTGHAPTTMNHTRLYVEVDFSAQGGGKFVYQARENKADEAGNVSYSTRLNSTAWEAMKARLGI